MDKGIFNRWCQSFWLIIIGIVSIFLMNFVSSCREDYHKQVMRCYDVQEKIGSTDRRLC